VNRRAGAQFWLRLDFDAGDATFSYGTGKMSPERIELGAAVHLTLDPLELGDLVFGLTAGPGFSVLFVCRIIA